MQHNKGKITEKKRVELKDIVIMVLAMSLLVCILFASFFYIDGGNTNTDIPDRASDYNDSWNLVTDGTTEIVDLPAAIKADSNGVVLMKKMLPDVIEENSAIMIRTYHQTTEVRVNGETRFRYPSERRKVNFNIISDEWILVPLKPEDARKKIEIKYTHNRGSYFDRTMDDVYVGEEEAVLRHLRIKCGWDYALSLTIVTMGGFLMAIGWLYRRFSNYKARACIGLVIFCLGVWLANRTKMPLFHLNADLRLLLALIGLTLVAPFLFLYSYFRFSDKWSKYSLLGFRLGLVLASVILLLLMFAGASIEVVVKTVFFTICIAAVYLEVLLYKFTFGKESKYVGRIVKQINKIEFLSVMILPLFVIVGIIKYPSLGWTESSTTFRVAANILMLSYIVSMAIYNYNESIQREEVIKKLHDSRMELMMGQIQPHFIFNTLSSIRTLIKISPDTAYDMLYNFSNYLRANVDNVTNLEGIKFSSEIEHIKSYVNIEKVRFGDRVNVEYDIQAKEFIVPPLSIQPLVENAIKHGICKKPEGGTVWLKSWEDDDKYTVIVQDNGVGFSQEVLERVFSVEDEADALEVMSEGDTVGTTIRDIIESSTLKDASGKALDLSVQPKGGLSGNGHEKHESTGMRNISLRLREMAGARMEIESQIGRGTLIKVYFPKDGLNG